MKNIIINSFRKIKRSIQCLGGYDCFFHPDLDIQVERIGSHYGGWMIPRDALKRDAIVYAAGIGTDISFDLGLIEQYGVEVHAFDPTPKVAHWLGTQRLSHLFVFHPWGFSDHDGVIAFHIPKNPNHISHSEIKSQVTGTDQIEVDVLSVPTTAKKLGHERIDLLKMDIEGSEYGVIEHLLKSGLRPSLLLVEFHHRFKSIGAQKTKRAVEELRRSGYQIYSVSATGEELCFMLPEEIPA